MADGLFFEKVSIDSSRSTPSQPRSYGSKQSKRNLLRSLVSDTEEYGLKG